MKVKLLIFIAILSVGIGYAIWDLYSTPSGILIHSIDQNYSSVQLNEPVPDFNFTDLKGNHYTLYSFDDKIILINFWATWCPPCITEFPDLLKLAVQYKKDMIFIAVSVDRYIEDIEHFIDQLPPETQEMAQANNVFLTWDHHHKISRDMFQIYRYPESILIDQNKNMVRKYEGIIDITDKKLHDLIKSIKSNID